MPYNALPYIIEYYDLNLLDFITLMTVKTNESFTSLLVTGSKIETGIKTEAQ